MTIQEDDAAVAIATPSHKDRIPCAAGDGRESDQPRRKRQKRKKKCSTDSGTEETTTTDDSSTDTHSERSSTNFSVIFNPKEGHDQKDKLPSTIAKSGPSKCYPEVGSIAAKGETATTSSEERHAKDQHGSFEWSFPPNDEDARSSR